MKEGSLEKKTHRISKALKGLFRGLRSISGSLQGIRERFIKFSKPCQKASQDFEQVSMTLQDCFRGFRRISYGLQMVRGGLLGLSMVLRDVSDDFQKVWEALQGQGL